MNSGVDKKKVKLWFCLKTEPLSSEPCRGSPELRRKPKQTTNKRQEVNQRAKKSGIEKVEICR